MTLLLQTPLTNGSKTMGLFLLTAADCGSSSWAESLEFLLHSKSLPGQRFVPQLSIMAHSNELCASVVGYPNNSYRCCENVEEGY